MEGATNGGLGSKFSDFAGDKTTIILDYLLSGKPSKIKWRSGKVKGQIKPSFMKLLGLDS